MKHKHKWHDISELADFLPDLNAAPEDIILISELRDNIKSAFENLSDKNRIVAEFYFLQGIRTPEIARKLKLPVGTVTYRLSEARAKLKGELKTMQESTNQTLPADFEQIIMEKVKNLNNYYSNHGSMDGFDHTLLETEALVRKLPDGNNKWSAIADIEWYRYRHDDNLTLTETEEQYQKAIQAAKKVNDNKGLLNILNCKYEKMYNSDKHKRISFINDEAIPLLTEYDYKIGIGIFNIELGKEKLK